MTVEDIKRVESALGITLPSAYSKVLAVFPVPAYAGNSEMMLWDDADALIALNRELRKGRSFEKPWPRRFFALGQDAGGCSDALDLDDPEFSPACGLRPIPPLAYVRYSGPRFRKSLFLP